MTNDKIQMTNKIPISNVKSSTHGYDLEERTMTFARKCLKICKTTPHDTINYELIKQLIRSACSVGANYREANDSITRKDFHHRIGICRREAKEARYWLSLLQDNNAQLSDALSPLINEATQLTRIFSSINNKRP